MGVVAAAGITQLVGSTSGVYGGAVGVGGAVLVGVVVPVGLVLPVGLGLPAPPATFMGAVLSVLGLPGTTPGLPPLPGLGEPGVVPDGPAGSKGPGSAPSPD